MALQVNITNTRTSFNFDVRDDKFSYNGSYSTGSELTGSDDVSCTITSIVDGTHVGNIYYSIPKGGDSMTQYVNFSINVPQARFEEIYDTVPEVITAIKAAVTDSPVVEE